MREQNIRDEYWHTLIILDACRYDCFEEICRLQLSGSLEKRWSSASCTKEWLMSQWAEFTDTVYISGNPFASQSAFLAILNIPWPFGGEEPLWDWGWNEELGTVPSEAIPIVVKRYSPEQRMIIHMMQPHHPFIANGKRILISDTRDRGWGPSRSFVKDESADARTITEWDLVLGGDIPEEAVITAYKESLAGTVPALKEVLAHRTAGTAIVTADHGELFEPPYGHPCENDHPDLHVVPWMVIGEKERKKTMPKKKEVEIIGEYYDKDYWNGGAQSPKKAYDSIESLEGIGREIAVDFMRVYEVPPGTRMLDLGCGAGYIMLAWLGRGIDVMGVDFSEYAVTKGKRLWPQLDGRVFLSPITDLSLWQDGEFDIVYCQQVLEHIYPDQAPQVAAEAFRVLRPGGMLWTAPVLANAWMDESVGDPRGDASHVNVQYREYWDDIFRAAGFKLYPNAEWRFAAHSQIYKKMRWQLACYLKPPEIPATGWEGIANGLYCLPVKST